MADEKILISMKRGITEQRNILRKEYSINMKNTNTTQRMTRNTAKCMTQRMFQKKMLNTLQQAVDKVSEAVNIVDEVVTMLDINVQSERCGRYGRSGQDKHSKHSDGNWDNHCDRNNHIDSDDIFYDSDEADNLDDLDYSDEINEVTLPELADMVSERTCFKPEFTRCVLNTAFELIDEQNLMLDLGTISADTSEDGADDDTEDADAEEGQDDETYAECGAHDCDNCLHYDDCHSESDGEYGDGSSYGIDDSEDTDSIDGIDTDSESYNHDDDCDDSYDCDDDNDYRLASQPTRNTTRKTRSGRQW